MRDARSLIGNPRPVSRAPYPAPRIPYPVSRTPYPVPRIPYPVSRTPMSTWIRIAAAADCPPGEAREFLLEDRIIALFHVGGRFYALDGICPHQGGPLGQGNLSGCVVTCPWHGWQFDVTTGQHQAKGALRQPSYPVRVEGPDIFVAVDG